MPEEAQPRNVTRADLVLTEGFGLEVDGRMKTVFPTLLVAEKKARDLKARPAHLAIHERDNAVSFARRRSEPNRVLRILKQ